MRALQFAIATATRNLASQLEIAFLFQVLATHGPSFFNLLQCGFQYCLRSCSPIPPLVVKMIGTKPTLFFDLQPESDSVFRRMSRVRGHEYVSRGVSSIAKVRLGRKPGLGYRARLSALGFLPS